jgi:hypothetical protein
MTDDGVHGSRGDAIEGDLFEGLFDVGIWYGDVGPAGRNVTFGAD